MSALDVLLSGYKLIQSAGVSLKPRPVINFVGATVADNVANGSTDVTLGGAGSAYPIASSPPLPSALTWVQQAGLVSGGTSSYVTDPSGKAFTLISPTPGDNAEVIHALVTPAPVAPYTFSLGIIPDGLVFASNYRMGLVLRESSTGKMLVLGISDQVTGTSVSNWTSATAHVGDDYLSSVLGGSAIMTRQSYNGNAPFAGPLYFRVFNDGTNLWFSRSTSGSFFMPHAVSSVDGITALGVAKNNFFTTGPDQIGVGLGNVNGAAPGIGMRVFSWATS